MSAEDKSHMIEFVKIVLVQVERIACRSTVVL